MYDPEGDRKKGIEEWKRGTEAVDKFLAGGSPTPAPSDFWTLQRLWNAIWAKYYNSHPGSEKNYELLTSQDPYASQIYRMYKNSSPPLILSGANKATTHRDLSQPLLTQPVLNPALPTTATGLPTTTQPMWAKKDRFGNTYGPSIPETMAPDGKMSIWEYNATTQPAGATNPAAAPASRYPTMPFSGLANTATSRYFGQPSNAYDPSASWTARRASAKPRQTATASPFASPFGQATTQSPYRYLAF